MFFMIFFNQTLVYPTSWTTLGLLLIVSFVGCISQTVFTCGAQWIDSSKIAVFRSTELIFLQLMHITSFTGYQSFVSISGTVLIIISSAMMIVYKPSISVAPPPSTKEVEFELKEGLSYPEENETLLGHDKHKVTTY